MMSRWAQTFRRREVAAFELDGGVAVVTGAASGLGRALVEALSRRGMSIAAVDIDALGLERLVAQAPSGVRITTHAVDVADARAMEVLVEEIFEEHGRVDVLVNNAGVSVAADLVDHRLEDVEWIVGINLWGVVHGCRLFLPRLLEQGRGAIVNISSVFGIIGVPGQSTYCMTKFAVRGLSEALSAELDGTGVHVLSVHPGGIRTNIARASRFAGERQTRRRAGVLRYFEERTLPAADAAALIVAAIERRQSRLLITPLAYVADGLVRALGRLPPRLVHRATHWLTDRL